MLTSSNGRVTSSGRSLRQRLGCLWPVSRTDQVAPVAVVTGTVAAAVLMLGRTATRFDSVWAEDGAIFLEAAETAPLRETLLEPYAGYAHVLPRVLAEIVTLLPLDLASVAFTVAAVAVSLLLAAMVFVALADHVPSPWARAAVVAFLVVLPVGGEAVGNIANLHWFLLLTSVCILFWTPRSRSGTATGTGVLAVAAMSSPFGLGLLAVAAVRAWVTRTRTSVVFALCLAVTVGIQLAVMLQAPDRDGVGTPSVVRLLSGYVVHVAAQTAFGERLAGDRWLALALGTFVSALVALLLWAGLRRGRSAPGNAFAAVMLAASLTTWVALYGLSGVAAPRYVIVPAVLLLVGCLALVTGERGVGGGSRTTRRVRAAVGTGIALAWLVSFPLGPTPEPGWSTEVAEARDTCASGPDEVELSIAPSGWEVTLPCSVIDDDADEWWSR
jgi:hypothetical protein